MIISQDEFLMLGLRTVALGLQRRKPLGPVLVAGTGVDTPSSAETQNGCHEVYLVNMELGKIE